MPALDPPRGVDVRTRRSMTSHHRTCERHHAWGELIVDFFKPGLDASAGRAAGTITFFVNPEPDAVAAVDARYLEDANGPMYRERPPLGSVGGFPASGTFWVSSRDAVVVLLSNRPEPFWVPVTRERWASIALPEAENEVSGISSLIAAGSSSELHDAEAADRKKANEESAAKVIAVDSAAGRQFLEELERKDREIAATIREGAPEEAAFREWGLRQAEDRLSALRGELARLTEPERDAWIRGTELVTAGTPGALRLVAPNDDYYHRGRRLEVQAIAVKSRAARSPYVLALQAEVLRTLRWPEIAALLQPARR